MYVHEHAFREPCTREMEQFVSNMNRVFLLTILTSMAGIAGAQPAAIAVQGQGFVADFYSSAESTGKTGILVLGGSEGGIPTALAKIFVDAGYPVLCPAYFKMAGTPEILEEIPLEYFDKIIAWMLGEGGMARGGIIAAGASKGAELALLLASRRPEIVGVIAISPSSVVWQGLPKSFWPVPKARSSWTAGRKELPFVSYDFSMGVDPSSLVDMYRQSLKNAAVDAAISVEKINGPVLLLSGADDRLWPSREMGNTIIAQLKANSFAYRSEHVTYPEAGHTLNENYMVGGSAEGNRKARIDVQARVLDFLKTNSR
jgi:dienelactone hydrolase